MFVYLFLLLLLQSAIALVHGSPLKRINREVSQKRVYGSPNILLQSEGKRSWPLNGDSKWKWEALNFNAEHTTLRTNSHKAGGRDLDWEKRNKKIADLDISKSIELIFDPYNQMLTPANGDSKSKKAENGYEISLSLLSSRTQKELKHIFEKALKEAGRGGGLSGVKNYQTGRFKVHHMRGTPIQTRIL